LSLSSLSSSLSPALYSAVLSILHNAVKKEKEHGMRERERERKEREHRVKEEERKRKDAERKHREEERREWEAERRRREEERRDWERREESWKAKVKEVLKNKEIVELRDNEREIELQAIRVRVKLMQQRDLERETLLHKKEEEVKVSSDVKERWEQERAILSETQTTLELKIKDLEQKHAKEKDEWILERQAFLASSNSSKDATKELIDDRNSWKQRAKKHEERVIKLEASLHSLSIQHEEELRKLGEIIGQQSKQLEEMRSIAAEKEKRAKQRQSDFLVPTDDEKPFSRTHTFPYSDRRSGMGDKKNDIVLAETMPVAPSDMSHHLPPLVDDSDSLSNDEFPHTPSGGQGHAHHKSSPSFSMSGERMVDALEWVENEKQWSSAEEDIQMERYRQERARKQHSHSERGREDTSSKYEIKSRNRFAKTEDASVISGEARWETNTLPILDLDPDLLNDDLFLDDDENSLEKGLPQREEDEERRARARRERKLDEERKRKEEAKRRAQLLFEDQERRRIEEERRREEEKKWQEERQKRNEEERRRREKVDVPRYSSFEPQSIPPSIPSYPQHSSDRRVPVSSSSIPPRDSKASDDKGMAGVSLSHGPSRAQGMGPAIPSIPSYSSSVRPSSIVQSRPSLSHQWSTEELRQNPYSLSTRGDRGNIGRSSSLSFAQSHGPVSAKLESRPRLSSDPGHSIPSIPPSIPPSISSGYTKHSIPPPNPLSDFFVDSHTRFGSAANHGAHLMSGSSVTSSSHFPYPQVSASTNSLTSYSTSSVAGPSDLEARLRAFSSQSRLASNSLYGADL
ncbi:hypothetical protein ADUPG1_014097, partial [Aduncisulcus paluster]